jgi:hypothetical protein
MVLAEKLVDAPEVREQAQVDEMTQGLLDLCQASQLDGVAAVLKPGEVLRLTEPVGFWDGRDREEKQMSLVVDKQRRVKLVLEPELGGENTLHERAGAGVLLAEVLDRRHTIDLFGQGAIFGRYRDREDLVGDMRARMRRFVVSALAA